MNIFKDRGEDFLTARARELGVSVEELLDNYATIGSIVDRHRKPGSCLILRNVDEEDILIPVEDILKDSSEGGD